MAKPPHLASDGLIARKSGPWALEKLHYLRRYFTIFNQGMKNHWPQRVFVDVLAGPGRCYLEDRPQTEFDGSPILAVQGSPSFTKAVFIESHKPRAAALERRLQHLGDLETDVQLLRRDCNSDVAIDTVRGALRGRDVLGLIFVDTLGLTDVPLNTLRRMTESARADVVFTFQVNDALVHEELEEYTALSTGVRIAPHAGEDFWQKATSVAFDGAQKLF